jgi:hypothetical protein
MRTVGPAFLLARNHFQGLAYRVDRRDDVQVADQGSEHLLAPPARGPALGSSRDHNQRRRLADRTRHGLAGAPTVALLPALHRRLDSCVGSGRLSAARSDVSPQREPRDGEPRFTSAGGNVEMLLIIGDAEALDNCCADQAQLIHDDRVPFLPAGRKPSPRGLAECLGSHRRSASALPLTDASTDNEGLLGGST